MDFPLDKFRILYPAFNSFDDAVVLAFSVQALCFVSGSGCKCTEALWMLMTAHLMALSLTDDAKPGIVASASIDKVSVSFQAPPATGSWDYWLNMTPYGQQFLALSKRCNAGGFYVGGNPERDAIRGVYGIRGGRRW